MADATVVVNDDGSITMSQTYDPHEADEVLGEYEKMIEMNPFNYDEEILDSMRAMLLEVYTKLGRRVN